MEFVVTILNSNPKINFQFGPINLAIYLFLVGAIVFMIVKTWNKKQINWREKSSLFIGLVLLIPVCSLFLAIKLPDDNLLPIPGVPLEPSSPIILLFSAIPWLIAGGVFGIGQSVLFAFIIGTLIAFFGTHNINTIFEVSGLAFLISYLIRQNYRTGFYNILRHPIAAAFFISVVYIPVYMVLGFMSTKGALAVRIDYAITQTWLVMISRAIEVIFAGIIAELYLYKKEKYWYKPEKLIPSPSERNLELKFFYRTVPLVVILVLILTIGDWIAAGRVTKDLLKDRLSTTASVAVEGLPYFLEIGQDLILDIAQPELFSSSEGLQDSLKESMYTLPYYRQLTLFNMQGDFITGYPLNTIEDINLEDEEIGGIENALNGVEIQRYIISPEKGETQPRVSFIAMVSNNEGEIQGVLIGRSGLFSNPYIQPSIAALQSMERLNGTGIILDEENRIIYHPDKDYILSKYIGKRTTTSSFFDEISPNGSRQIVFFQPSFEGEWAVVLTVPAEQMQKMILNIASPLLIILLVISIIAFFALRYGLRHISTSLESLSREATLISQGDFEHQLIIDQADEVGKFSQAFEKMRKSLKSRLEELNSLLLVSQNSMSTLSIDEIINYVLTAALFDDAVSARLVLQEDFINNDASQKIKAFYIGKQGDLYSGLDDQIFRYGEKEKTLIIPNIKRSHILSIGSIETYPEALIASAIRLDKGFLGTLWVAFDRPYEFSKEQVQFISTLSGLAALALSNARLFAIAETGQNQLSALLSSSPDPIVVIDENNKLLLTNQAAVNVPGLLCEHKSGIQIDQVFDNKELLSYIENWKETNAMPFEFDSKNGKTYSVNITPIKSEETTLGKICNFKDVSLYKEKDILKSEFLETVSHDLRYPLSLIKGNISMLDIVGEVNKQQADYLLKITSEIDEVNNLIENLLNIERIESGLQHISEDVDMGNIIDISVARLSPQIEQKKISINKMPSLKGKTRIPIVVKADKTLIERAFINLIENSIKYSPIGGTVIIDIQQTVSNVKIIVSDNGTGIAPLDLERIFDKLRPKQALDSDTQSISSKLGIGLYIVKMVAELHHGRVWAESELGKGSTFYFEIPYGV